MRFGKIMAMGKEDRKNRAASSRSGEDPLGDLAHDLRTPLSVITMYSELLVREGDLKGDHLAEECRAYAEEIRDAAKKMAGLVNELLEDLRRNGGTK